MPPCEEVLVRWECQNQELLFLLRTRTTALPSELMSYNDQEQTGRMGTQGSLQAQSAGPENAAHPSRPQVLKPMGQGFSRKTLLKIHQEPSKGRRQGVGPELHPTGSMLGRWSTDSQSGSRAPVPPMKAPGRWVLSAEGMGMHCPVHTLFLGPTGTRSRSRLHGVKGLPRGAGKQS